ncbi:GntR family transcriptional regulator [Candidimonas nitroreducens]|uniref:GntR family transcriptional regulator n=2 Tax=Candidimonas nitroreducens TaxID=683354 RepID=A0A225MWE4_9BURK|nr:GntR family transcriptional regulator [Candidimonas nitroreducens]
MSATPNAAPDEKSTTLAEQAYLNLKRDIMDGVLAPGQPLRLEFLKQKYHLSFSPLREALNRLQSERLVDAFALKGFRVSPLSTKEMWDAINARILIDCEALRRSIAAGSDDWESRIVAALHALDRATGKTAAPDELQAHHDLVEQRHLALHRALIDACDSRWLLDFSMTLYVQTERYRRPMLLNLPKSATPRDVSREHHEIVAATLQRDAGQACGLLAQHYSRTAQLIEQSLGGANAPQR